MRIVVFSDPHVDINARIMIDAEIEENFIDILIENLATNHPDVLVCAGDVTPETNFLKTTLKSIKTNVESDFYIFIPGNHDVWFRPPADHSGQASSSLDKYQRVLPKICQEIGFTFLPGNPFTIDQVGFLGSIGWYDYSFRNTKWDTQIDLIHYASKRYQGTVWNDVNYGEWEMADIAVCQYLLSTLDQDYNLLLDQDINESILILHHVPFKQFVTYKDDLTWDFFSSFIGSQQFGDWALRHSEIKTIVFGHTHFPQEAKIKGITNYCVPIGYFSEVEDSLKDIHQFVKSRVKVITK
ncbi:MAG: metallophosphoesterase [Promethearchaeota archaeon]